MFPRWVTYQPMRGCRGLKSKWQYFLNNKCITRENVQVNLATFLNYISHCLLWFMALVIESEGRAKNIFANSSHSRLEWIDFKYRAHKNFISFEVKVFSQIHRDNEGDEMQALWVDTMWWICLLFRSTISPTVSHFISQLFDSVRKSRS